MKKILSLSVILSAFLWSQVTLAANFAPISCSNARVSNYSNSCDVCFDAGSLYYRSDRAVENITNFYDNFSVTGSGSRVMWQDETSVAWSQLNSDFFLGSSLSSNRANANGFKFQIIPGLWQTAQNAPNTGRYYGLFPAGSTTKYVASPGGISLNGVASTATPADRNTAMWRINFNAASRNFLGQGQQGPLINHRQCAFLFPQWCGDGVVDTGRGEQCDDGNMNSGDGCSNICQPESPALCTNLSITPTSVVNGGNVTYTCMGVNVSSYSVQFTRPDGSILQTLPTQNGSVTIPASPTGTYTARCFVNGQSTTPASCQKTVENTTVTPICNNLTVTPTGVVNGGSITYTCSGTNVSSYSIIARSPDGSIFASQTGAAGSIIVPASPLGTYSISCFVNGQVSTPASCQKTVTNTTVVEPVCTNLTVTPTSVVNGGNVTYTCTGNNVTSWSIQFSRPDGSIFQTLTTPTGSATIPASPTGIYTARCFINGQTSTPEVCQKTVTNTPNPTPQIDIDKRDANSADLDGSIGNDTQTVTSGTAAVFKIRVTNNGTEDLRNLVLSDAMAPNCAGNVTLPSTFPGTWSNWAHGGSGNNTDNILQVGEWFEYTCNRANTTAPYTNTATVNATGVTSGIPVDDTDPTPVLVSTPEPVCTNLSVTPTSVVNGGNVTYTCTGNNVTSWSIQFSRPDGNVFQALTTPTGSVTIPATPTGTYTAKCFVNGQTTTPPACQKTVENTTTTTPTCDNLTVSTTGTTVNYACTGTNATSYRITQNGTQIGTGSSGSVNVGYGTFTFICYVNDSITSSACQKTVTTSTNPLIQVIKDDNDNHDDRQFLQTGAAATFTIVVKNPGTEALSNVTLADQYAPECNRNSSQTQAMIVNVGNRDNRLDPGESFSYICTRNNVDTYTFPNNENRICVDGQGSTSGIPVNSCDVTRIEFGSAICQNLQVTQNGNQINAICGPSGSYRLFVLEGPRVVNTYQSNNGQFNFTVGDSNYKLVCVRDGEQTVQPNCQKTITATPKSNYCTMTSSTQFGGAPLRTKLDCRSNTYAQCHIRIMKDGKAWGNIADCYADMVFEEKGVYDATCVIDNNEEQTCSTRVQVDIMTVIRTGPFLPLLIVIAMSTAGYLAYRRRKTV